MVLFALLYILVFLILPVFSKGGGGSSQSSGSSSSSSGRYYSGGSSSNTHWVWWYYDPYGNRSCGNVCITTLSIVGFIILGIIACGILRCVQIARDSRRERDLEKAGLNRPPDETYPSSFLPSNDNSPTDITTPPTYEGLPTAPEKVHKRGKYKNAKQISSEAADRFTSLYPPTETYPPPDHQQFINESGGAPAYAFVPEGNLLNAIRVEDQGRVVHFYGQGDDAMVQTNYPLFVPGEVSPNGSGVGSNHLNTIDAPPKYEASGSESQILHYFEITVVENPSNATIAVGLATKPYPNFRYVMVTILVSLALIKIDPDIFDRLPGWNEYSVGYHSDDGRKFNDDPLGGRDYGHEWGTPGDTIGCGYHPDTG
jgi:hypothetical protein